jgi:hypothetical protein
MKANNFPPLATPTLSCLQPGGAPRSGTVFSHKLCDSRELNQWTFSSSGKGSNSVLAFLCLARCTHSFG